MNERDALIRIVEAWEAIRGGRNYSAREIEKWLANDMAPAINEVRQMLGRRETKWGDHLVFFKNTEDEQEIFNCGYCSVPILTFWGPNGGGLLRGDYLLAGDVLFHPKCFDKYYEEFHEQIQRQPLALDSLEPPPASNNRRDSPETG